MTSPIPVQSPSRPRARPLVRSIAVGCALAAASILSSCARHAEPAPFVTLNKGYDRISSRILIRRIDVPTRANLDYAAYAANIILYDTARVEVHPGQPVSPERLAFGGTLSDLTTRPPLADSERARPMAWKPVEDLLLAWNFEAAAPLVEAAQAIGMEKWGDTSDVAIPFQEIAALCLHRNAEGKDEAWVRIEFKPWMAKHLEKIEDADGDGFADIWARLSTPKLTPEMLALLRGDYSGKVLTRAEAFEWANALAALWYPVYNTDVVDVSSEGRFPLESTEPEVVRELQGLVVENPLCVFRGRPFQVPLYNVFVLGDDSAMPAAATQPGDRSGSGSVDSTVPARLDSIRSRISDELSAHDGQWSRWIESLSSLRTAAAKLAGTAPAAVAGLEGREGYLVFRRELEYLQAGDVLSAAPENSPAAAICRLQRDLAAKGIDFLFVPVPTKQDVYPEILSQAFGFKEAGYVQPWERRFLAALADSGVETIDLLPPFVSGRGSLAKDALYRRQDTHWTPRGAARAAEVLAARIRQYPWFAAAYATPIAIAARDTIWRDLGDIQARLPAERRATYRPEELSVPRFFLPDGTPYDDRDDAPVLLLGDSYLGVYQKVAPKAGGLSAHLAARLQGPVAVLMGWGGGPEAPRKLAARGDDFLAGKRLVVWTMSVRDVFAYPGGWGSP